MIRQEKELQADWLRLDNAAKIYPSTASEESPAEFRLAFTLKKPVRLLWLQRALERIMPRFPYFQVHLRRGFFWYYLQRSEVVPKVELLKNVPVSIISLKERTAPLVRVSARERTVAVDFSHILTDGNGGMRFLMSLAAEYVRQSGSEVEQHPAVLDPDVPPDPEEFEDAHRRNFEKGTLQPEGLRPAYHIPGRPFKTRRFRVLKATMPVDKLLQLARQRKVTLTEYLVSTYMYSLIQIYKQEQRGRSIVRPRRKKEGSILRMEVPVDMRRYKPSRTMRNFSLYISPEIDLKLGDYDFAEVLKHMHHTIQLLKNGKQLGRQLSRNVGSEMNPFVRFSPLFVKDMVTSFLYARFGEALHSGVLSNLGPVQVPPALEERLEGMHFDLNPNHVMKKACGVLSFKNQLVVSFTSVIESRELERIFFTHLTSRGIPITLEEF
ncbi:MAG: hypothetical protein K9L66_01310 [Spirochaetaceae bacterium]|nr:hypothetical protein [Spirochaetaceae bacterium]MCF7947213.1 hypothetical protein [Spirochaetia bacterium]MCF7950252.1 hypothetical protein [Spirochaetaceae bacterium]